MEPGESSARVSRDPVVDVVVVGAGLVGACCARFLLAQGLTVAVVDTSGPVGGTTGSGEGNILLSDKEPGPELTLALRSRQLWDVLAAELTADSLPATPDIEFDAKGGLVVVADESELAALHAFADAQQAAGVLVERLGPAGILAAEPAVNPALAGGVRYSQDAQVLPMVAAAALLAAAARSGAHLIWPARVTGARHNGHGRITGVRTTGGDIATGTVVNACGPWAGEVATLLGGSLPVRPRRGHILVTEPLPHRFIRHKVYEGSYVAAVASDATALVGSAVVESTRAGTVLIGSTREFAGWSTRTSTAALGELARRAIALVPALAGVRAQRSYLGFRPASPDHLPLIGPDIEVAGLVHASGHEGAGIGLAPGTAELVTAIVTGVDGPVAATAFAPARLSGVLV
jgi:glycine/D-amino acid oxidase-like deaminating enzyme